MGLGLGLGVFAKAVYFPDRLWLSLRSAAFKRLAMCLKILHRFLINLQKKATKQKMFISILDDTLRMGQPTAIAKEK